MIGCQVCGTKRIVEGGRGRFPRHTPWHPLPASRAARASPVGVDAVECLHFLRFDFPALTCLCSGACSHPWACPLNKAGPWGQPLLPSLRLGPGAGSAQLPSCLCAFAPHRNALTLPSPSLQMLPKPTSPSTRSWGAQGQTSKCGSVQVWIKTPGQSLPSKNWLGLQQRGMG